MSIYPSPKIFFSAPSDEKLDALHITWKKAIRNRIKKEGYQIQEFGAPGIASHLTAWTFNNARQVISGCQGAIFFAYDLGQYVTRANYTIVPTSEYIHIEGEMAQQRSLPMLIVVDRTLSARGLLATHVQNHLLIPSNATNKFVSSAPFKIAFDAWSAQVKTRYHVFLGYSSGATSTANDIANYLASLGVRVLDWQSGFMKGGTILEQIESADQTCLGGIFLFTKDDHIESKDEKKAAPRDNVVFEAGYFMNSKGKERTLLICEDGVKVPADVGGNIYITLKDRNNITPIQPELRKFIADRF